MFNNRMEEWINACPRVKFTSWALSAFSPQTTFMWPFSLLSAQDHQQESKSEESSDPTSYAGATPSLELEQELHYSSIIFRGGVALFLHHLPWGEASGEPSLRIRGDQDQVRHRRPYEPQHRDVASCGKEDPQADSWRPNIPISSGFMNYCLQVSCYMS